MKDRIIKIDLNQDPEDILDKYEKEKIPILEKMLNIGLNYYIPEDEKDKIINELLLNESDTDGDIKIELPYFPESHREAYDLINTSMNKLNQELERKKEKEDDGGGNSITNNRY